MELSALKNLGPASCRQLARIGIESAEALREIGSVEAFVRLKLSGTRVSLVMLYALEGGLLDMHWNALPAELKAELSRRVRETLEALGAADKT